MTKDDLISRQAAIDAIRASASKYTGFMEMEMYTDDDAVEAINGVPSAQQWIPCSKRLPEEGKQVLVCDDAGFIYTAEGETRIFDGEWQWYESVEYRPMDDVVAWMPLPEPWRGEEDG